MPWTDVVPRTMAKASMPASRWVVQACGPRAAVVQRRPPAARCTRANPRPLGGRFEGGILLIFPRVQGRPNDVNRVKHWPYRGTSETIPKVAGVKHFSHRCEQLHAGRRFRSRTTCGIPAPRCSTAGAAGRTWSAARGRVGGRWRFAPGEINQWLERRIGVSDTDELARVEARSNVPIAPAVTGRRPSAHYCR